MSEFDDFSSAGDVSSADDFSGAGDFGSASDFGAGDAWAAPEDTSLIPDDQPVAPYVVDDGFNDDPTPSISPEDFGIPASAGQIDPTLAERAEQSVRDVVGNTAYDYGEKAVHAAEEFRQWEQSLGGNN
jgi:hypothetical protein